MPLSYRLYNGDGSTDTFAIGFNYIEESHIKVYESVSGSLVERIRGTDWNVVGSPPNADVVFVTNIPGVGTENVRILRETPRELSNQLVAFSGKAQITEADLDTLQKQLLFIAQEALETDSSGQLNPNAEFITYDGATGGWNAKRSSVDTKIGGVDHPDNNDEVATKKYVDDIATWGVAAIPQVFHLQGQVGGSTSFTLTGGANIDEEMVVVWWTNGSNVTRILQPGAGRDFTITKGDPDSTLNFETITIPVSENVTVLNFGRARFVSSTLLEDLSVTTAKLANDCVTNAKIADDAVGPEHLADNAVVTAAIADDAVDTDEIATDAVKLDHLDTTGTAASSFFGSSPSGWSTDRVMFVDKSNGQLKVEGIVVADISDFISTLASTALDSFAAPAGNLAMNSKKITGLAEPTVATDAATKNYVDNQVAGSNTDRVELLVDEILAGPGDLSPASSAWISTTYRFYEVYLFDGGVGTPNVDFEVASTWYNTTANFTALADTGEFVKFTLYNVAQGNCIVHCQNTSETTASSNVGAVTNVRFGVNQSTRIMIYGHKAKA